MTVTAVPPAVDPEIGAIVATVGAAMKVNVPVLFAALNVLDGQVIAECTAKHRHLTQHRSSFSYRFTGNKPLITGK